MKIISPERVQTGIVNSDFFTYALLALDRYRKFPGHQPEMETHLTHHVLHFKSIDEIFNAYSP